MDVERVAEVIRKAKIVLSFIKDPSHKTVATLMVQAMEESLKVIKEEGVPCPPELEAKLEQSFTLIEQMYDRNAAN